MKNYPWLRGAGMLPCLFLFILSLDLFGAPYGEGNFESLGIPVRAAGLMGCIVGPNGTGGDALYFNFNQTGGHLFLVQVDPDTGDARQFNSPEGPGAWAIAAAPDGNIYLGTWDGGRILKFDPREPQRGIQVLGTPAKTESYIWQFALDDQGRIYGSTYPHAKLIRFDPRSGKMEDLGQMHPTEMYARSVAVGPNGKVYVGVGTEQGDLVMFDPQTGKHHSIFPKELRHGNEPVKVTVSHRADGNIYAEFDKRYAKMDDETATFVPTPPPMPPIQLRDGRVVSAFGRGTFTVKSEKEPKLAKKTFKYQGAGDQIFVLGIGPSNCVYGSTIMPLDLFRFDPATKTSTDLGSLPGGEVYSMIEEKGKLYFAYYPEAIINLYDPAKPIWRFGKSPEDNPITFGGIGPGHLRPRALVRGPGGLFYIGSEPPYGELGGALGVWDPNQNKTVENYPNLIKNQSIVSLAFDPGTGLLFGGSGNFGGGGTRPVEKEAKFFAFDPRGKKKVFEETLVPHAEKYNATLAANGKIYTTVSNEFLIFDPKVMKVTRTLKLPGTQTDVSLGLHRSGAVIGLTSKDLYVFDPDEEKIISVLHTPEKVTAGFALIKDDVYFGSKAQLWRYSLPQLRPSAKYRQ